MAKGFLSIGKSKPKAEPKAKPGKKNKVEDDNGPGVNLQDMGSPSGLSAGGGRGKPSSKNTAPQPVATAGRHNDRSASNADDIAWNNPNGPYGNLPKSAKKNEYEQPDSPLGDVATVTPAGNYTKAPAKSRAAKDPVQQPQATGPNPSQPIAATNHGTTGQKNTYDDTSVVREPSTANAELPLPLVRPPSNAAVFFRKLKPETKKGAAIYGTLAAVIVAGVVLGTLGSLGLLDSANNNQSSKPTAKDAEALPGVTGDKATGIKKTALTNFDLKTLVTTSDDAEINKGSFLLYTTTDAAELGSKTVKRLGDWAVSDQGILTFTPDSTADFGTAEILYTAADTLGRVSERATITVKYGPTAEKLDLQELDPQKATLPISLSMKVTPVSSAEDSKIDFSTLQLVYRDKGPNGTNGDVIGTTVKLPMVGVWQVTDGAVIFTPAPGFVGTMISVGYRVSDKRGIYSNESSIVLLFKPTSVVIPPKDPMAKPTLGYMPDISLNTSKMTGFMISSVGTLAENSLEVAATAGGVFGKSVVAIGQGEWIVTGNSLAFNRSPDFLGAPTPIYYRAKSTANVQSDIYELTLGIFPPPVTTDDSFAGLRATIDVLKNDRIQYTLEGNSIDRTSLQFMNVTTGNPADPVPQIWADGKKAIVSGQGEWEILPENQLVTFVPITGFTGMPAPVYYSVTDTKGSESRPTKITINPESANISMLVNTLLVMQPNDFWTSFTRNFANSPLDEVLVATFLVARLLSKDFNAAQIANTSAVGVGLSDMDRTAVFTAWMTAKFSVATLVNQVKDLAQNKLNVPGQGGVAVLQVLRLREMIVAMDKYFDTLAAMRK